MIERIQIIFRIIFGARVLVLERRLDHLRHKDAVTLYGTLTDKAEQVDLLRRMADSIFQDMTPEEKENLRRLQSNLSKCQSPPGSTTRSSE